MKVELILTKDGTHSLFIPDLNETYHSLNGALDESQFIYIDQGLKTFINPKSDLSILEIGFGTGLNAILTLKESLANNLNISYTTLEPFPLAKDIVDQLNYPQFLNNEYLSESFSKLHNYDFNETIKINKHFTFCKKNITLEDFEAAEKFDLVYFDAFAPSKQAGIWALANFQKLKAMMNPAGILITYCSSSQFKRDLKAAGFKIESLPGPVGKREITRASI